jgi:hypothetical protein
MKWCLIVLGVVLGGLSAASYWNLTRIREYVPNIKTTPQTIKAADLAANGPGDNPFVTLTDFKFRPSDVQVSVWKGNQQQMTGSAYFPLEPIQQGKKQAQQAEEKTPGIVVIASADTPDKVKAFLNRRTITGMVKGSTFESWETKKVPVEWSVEGRPPELVWFVWADEKPEKTDLGRTEKVSMGLGLAGLVCLMSGALAFARGGGAGRRG